MRNAFGDKIRENIMKYWVLFSVVLLFAAAFLADAPGQIFAGLKEIVISRDALITDYFLLAGKGAAFFNAGVVLLICTALVMIYRIPFTGPTLAALFMNAGFALWGKNPVNILPVLFGTYLYSRLHGHHFGRYIYTALFGTCLAPLVTELVYLLPFSHVVNLVLAALAGILAGFLLSPLSMHTTSMHMGYNLFNVGFSAGILAFVIVCVLRSFGYESKTALLWQEGRSIPVLIGLYVYILLTFLVGLWTEGGSFKKLGRIMKRPGRAVTDFALMDGPGATLMNMALVGAVGLTYILVVGGDLSGPVVGGILMMMGFSSFGAHVRNYLPVLAGVFGYSLISRYGTLQPGIQLAALFGVGLAPIAGQFGVIAGLLTGMLHTAVVMCTSGIYGGLNLYNNGFSAGWVAIVMVPVLESFIKRFKDKKER